MSAARDVQQARALPTYFGRDRGLTHYAFVSDQHTHFATRVIRATVRDTTHVLDGILDNKSHLPIRTHSTDTAGYSDMILDYDLQMSAALGERGRPGRQGDRWSADTVFVRRRLRPAS